MHTWSEMGLKVPQICLPGEGTDMEKWAVVACDQYTSEPDYWKKAEDLVGDAPSTLRLMLPEYYLGKPDEEARIRHVRTAMKSYLEDGTLSTLPAGCMLVRRTALGNSRLGLVIAVDLEAYDYNKGSTSRIRATEKTITERIPPRLRIRRGAPIELPHIIILIDDPDKTVIEPLEKAPGKVLYDTDLMLGGGHITGRFISEKEMGGAREALSRLYDRASEKFGKGKEFLMAMGDGNHSLATAKAAWEEIKEGLTEEEKKDHPARFALCELENVHDPGIVFAPIHRVLFGGGKMSGDEIVEKTVQILKEQNGDAYMQDRADETGANGPSKEYRIPVISGGVRKVIVIQKPVSGLEVGALQNALDRLVDETGLKIDYIHGDATVEGLAESRENAGFLLPPMDKFRLFAAVAADGALPRKTFSMGQACEKRYYMEARKLY